MGSYCGWGCVVFVFGYYDGYVGGVGFVVSGVVV